jgi:hypothetical protein
LQCEKAAAFTFRELQNIQYCLFTTLQSAQANVTNFITITRKILVDKFRFERQSRFHLVVDEAQFAADECTASFRSEKTMTLRRPIIRELLLAWTVTALPPNDQPILILFSGIRLGSNKLNVAFSSEA